MDVDSSSESVSKKIRNAQLAQYNYILTVGDREIENQVASLRTRDNKLHGEIIIEEFITRLQAEKHSRSLTSAYQSKEV